jgi:hypothetical protein
MWPFKPKWECDDWEKRIQGIAELNSLNSDHQKILSKIAKNDKISDVRKAAVDKITDQKILADIAKSDKDPNVCKAAVEKITDQNVLVDVVNYIKDWQVRLAVVSKLTDNNDLSHIAKNDLRDNVRNAAMEKIFILKSSDSNLEKEPDAKIETNHKIGLKILLVSFFVIVACIAGYILIPQRAERGSILYENDFKRIGYAMELYAANHNNNFPPSWDAASKEMALWVRLRFCAGTKNSPLSEIRLDTEYYAGSNLTSGIYYFEYDENGEHLPGADTSQKINGTTGLFIHSTLVSNISYPYLGKGAKMRDSRDDSPPFQVITICKIDSLVLLDDGRIEYYDGHPEWIQKFDSSLYFYDNRIH